MALRLCGFNELRDPGSKGFVVDLDGQATEIFIVRKGDAVYGYRNSCPHTGGPLDWKPDEYLDGDGEHILCATHAALFRIEDGLCVGGPCKRQHLTPVPLRIEAGDVLLD